MNPKVSVVISTYNRPEFLDRALASVGEQTFDDFEVVVVDDCSPPSGPELPQAYRDVFDKHGAILDKRGIELWPLRLGENSGYQCMPKNIGINNSSGDYIAYLDDDNTWRPDHLEVCVKAIEEDFSTDLVYTRMCNHIESVELHDKLVELHGREIHAGDTAGHPWDPGALHAGNYIDTSTILHSKGAFWRMVRETGYGWDETLRRFADWNFVWRWGVVGNTGKLVDKVTLDYYVHSKMLQVSRPSLEVPVCVNYAAYRAMRKDRNHELSVAS